MLSRRAGVFTTAHGEDLLDPTCALAAGR